MTTAGDTRQAATVTRIRVFPIKSCGGGEVSDAVVEPWGLVGDRRWMVVDANATAITARTAHRLLLVHAEPSGRGLVLSAPGAVDLAVPVPDGTARLTVEVWDDRVDAAAAGPAADGWLEHVLGEPASLVFLDDPTVRPSDPGFSAPDDRVSFADGFPLLLVSEESVAAVNAAIAEGRYPAEGPVSDLNFRPNIVVSDVPAWGEDAWLRVRVGAVEFRVASACSRCVLTTVDPVTGRRARHEPVAALARLRRWDGKTWFGLNLIPDLPRPLPGRPPGADAPVVRVGDAVHVLEWRAAEGGPLR